MVLSRALTLVAAAAMLAPPAIPHGASQGLHLHLEPERAARGTTVEVRADAAAPLVSLRLSFVAGEPVEIVPDAPSRRIVATLAVPEATRGETASLHAEGRTVDGKVLRASAVLRLSPLVNSRREKDRDPDVAVVGEAAAEEHPRPERRDRHGEVLDVRP